MGRSAIHAQTGRMEFYILRTQGHRLADAPPDGDVLRLIGARITVKPLVLRRQAQGLWNLENHYRVEGVRR
jgi:hypothetical protein